ncbi:hypothetical protein EDB87DRAFT_1581541 [Lactarius vividus]|nr:hypothetical protein EDB87DRAFT_1581541 [Lactarius vividus]
MFATWPEIVSNQWSRVDKRRDGGLVIPDTLGDLLLACDAITPRWLQLPRELLVGSKEVTKISPWAAGCRSASVAAELTKIVGAAQCRSSTEAALKPGIICVNLVHHYDALTSHAQSITAMPRRGPNSESAEKEAKRLEREARLTSKVAKVEYEVDAQEEERGRVYIVYLHIVVPRCGPQRPITYSQTSRVGPDRLKYKSVEVVCDTSSTPPGYISVSTVPTSVISDHVEVLMCGLVDFDMEIAKCEKRDQAAWLNLDTGRYTKSDHIEAIPAGVRLVDEDRENVTCRRGNRFAGILKGDV